MGIVLSRRWPGLILLLGAVACRAPLRQPGAIRVVDDAGDTVTLARPATRVVSLIPATTELLFAIGAGDAVVGRTAYCDYPAEALAVPAVGDGILPNIEAVVARRPDLVVLYSSSQNAISAAQLSRLGIASIRVRSDQLADVPRLAKLLGKLTAHQAGADSLALRFRAQLDSASQPPSRDTLGVMLLVWADPPMTVGAGSFLSELVARAGGRNIYDDLPASSGQISVESAVRRNPDVVLVLGDSAPSFARRPEWQAVPAVRERRFVFASGSMFSQPSPRAPEAITTLARRFRRVRP